jgi:hypothetical protein
MGARRLNSQQFSPLLHGTNVSIAPGGRILPGRRDTFYPDGPPAAYATRSSQIARTFASQAERNRAKEARTQGKPYQLSLFYPIYEVSHLSEHSDPEGEIAILPHGSDDYVRDEEGFKVEGVNHYMVFDEDPYDPPSRL